MRPVWMSVRHSKNSSSVPKPPGENGDRLGAHHEMHLSDGEIVEVEAELRRHVDVWRLLVRQHNVEADRRRAFIGSPSVSGFHDARPTAGDNDIFVEIEASRIFRAEPGKLARLLVIDGGGLQIGALDFVARRPCALARRRNAGAAEHHDGRLDAAFREHHFHLQQFELQAHRTQFLAAEKILVGIGKAIGGRERLWRLRHGLGALLVGLAGLQRIPDPVLAPEPAVASLCHVEMPFSTAGQNCRICRYNALNPDMISFEKSFHFTRSCDRADRIPPITIPGDPASPR